MKPTDNRRCRPMNKNAFLREENLLTLISLNNFIVPEIQREYVWGLNPDVIKGFLSDIREAAKICDKCNQAHGTAPVNIGFLYSYKPFYAVNDNASILDEYLIDGQQRMTTLFLLLLYRSVVENRFEDFRNIIRISDDTSDDGSSAFNYKVRDLTQKFLIKLLNHCNESKPQRSALEFVKDVDRLAPSWLLDDYRNDCSVSAMLAALKIIAEEFNNPDEQYFDFILTKIRFWHFKTDATSQGEELYITMNARGEQLVNNEMRRAEMLPAEQQVKWGTKWELWQALFWKNRMRGLKPTDNENLNADRGFNNFIDCVDGLEQFHNAGKEKHISIEDMEVYIEALARVTGNGSTIGLNGSTNIKDSIKRLYPNYSGWFEQFENQLWSIINHGYDADSKSGSNEWIIPNVKAISGDEAKENARRLYNNSSPQRNRTMLTWGWLWLLKLAHDSGKVIGDELLIRVLHFWYVRYNTYKRSTTTIDAIAKFILELPDDRFILNTSSELSDGDADDDTGRSLFSNEEQVLSKIFDLNQSNQEYVESLVWEIQNHDWILDGAYVGGDTICHFIKGASKNNDKLDRPIDKDNAIPGLEIMVENFRVLLTDKNKVWLKSLMLFFTDDEENPFSRQSPYYYCNFETDTWKKNVRAEAFIRLYVAHFSAPLNKHQSITETLNGMLSEEEEKFFNSPGNNVLRYYSMTPWSNRKLLILYNFLTRHDIWKASNNVAFAQQSPSNRFQKAFYQQNLLFHASRYKWGDAITLPENWRDTLITTYPTVKFEFF